MKTYYDGEDREITEIYFWSVLDGKSYWAVRYRRGESTGSLLVPATDELDAMRKFPEELAKLSKIYEDDNNVS